MEHMQILDSDVKIEIPLVGIMEYDGGEFDSYPKRQGWDEEAIFTQRDFGHASSVVVETFFQTWLYFGFLICTFRIVGIPVHTADFLSTSSKGKKIITTQRLPRYIQQWREQYESAKVRDGRDTKDEHWSNILKILRIVHDYASRYCNEYSEKFNNKSASLPSSRAHPISPQVSLSIIALGQAITSAATTIYKIPQADLQMPWGTSSFLRKRLCDEGWCPKDISMLSDPRDASLELQYHLATVPYSRASIDHLRCTKIECSQERVDTDHYITQHVSSDCQCKTLDVEENVLGVLRQGGMPLVSFRTCGSQGFPTVDVVDYKSQSLISNKYVAISHVWADGLGNRQVNGLPICQLSRLQILVNNLYTTHPDKSSRSDSQSAQLTRFWIDTLCVPLHDNECRISAICEMRDVYRLADRVLVLDSWILKGSTEDTISNRSMRLMMSNWQRRLWTLSEAVLARNLYIQYGNASEPIQRLFNECRKYFQSSAEFYDSMPAYALAKSLPTLWFGPNVPLYMRFDALVYHIGQRTTSWPSDETICFSNLLGLSTNLLLEIPRKNLLERMAKFLRMVGTFRQQIIFDSGPRCQAEGFGWAPATFLNRLDAQVVTDRGKGDGRVGNLNPCGGLLVTYPGIKLDFVGPWVLDRCIISLRNQSDFGLLCSLRTDDEPYKPTIALNDLLNYFIISYIPLTQLLLDNGPSQSIALVGSVKDIAKPGPLQIQFLHRVILLRLSKLQLQAFEQYWSQWSSDFNNEDSEARLVQGTLLDDSQEWCVV